MNLAIAVITLVRAQPKIDPEGRVDTRGRLPVRSSGSHDTVMIHLKLNVV